MSREEKDKNMPLKSKNSSLNPNLHLGRIPSTGAEIKIPAETVGEIKGEKAAGKVGWSKEAAAG
jgi:hypothetical protein